MMKALMKLPNHIKEKGFINTASLLLNIGTGVIDFYLNLSAKKQSKLPMPDNEKIRSDLEAAGVKVISYKIDVDDFKIWLKKASFPERYVNSYGGLFVEKALEHYVGAQLLELRSEDILIDVAAAHSPWFNIAERLYSCKAYALDLSFPAGIHGKMIGADATNMPIPEGFATKMALHCAYEMFEGDADIRLLPETKRVLAENGRMAILPLYMHNFYFAHSSPFADRRGLDYQGAERVWRDDGNKIRFSRKYSVKAFVKRVISNLHGLKLKVFYIENEKEVDNRCYIKFATVFEK